MLGAKLELKTRVKTLGKHELGTILELETRMNLARNPSERVLGSIRELITRINQVETLETTLVGAILELETRII